MRNKTCTTLDDLGLELEEGNEVLLPILEWLFRNRIRFQNNTKTFILEYIFSYLRIAILEWVHLVKRYFCSLRSLGGVGCEMELQDINALSMYVSRNGPNKLKRQLPLKFKTKTPRLRFRSEFRIHSHTPFHIHFIFTMAVREERVTEENDAEEAKRLMLKIAAILDEARTSYATHNRKLKELSLLRSKSSSHSHFFSGFSKTITPLFDFQRRLASADRIVSFVSAFAATAAASGDFLDHFLKFLLAAAAASNKTARFRACQIVSEVLNSPFLSASEQIFNL